MQAPVRELRKLRKDLVQIAATSVSAGEHVLEHIRGDQLELEATFEVGSAEALGIIVHRADGQGTWGPMVGTQG